MNAALSCKTLALSSLFNAGRIERDKDILRQLADELDVVQSRLGTDKEHADDCDLARDLGHKIRNKLLVLHLWESLGFTKMPTDIRRRIAPVVVAK
ncbi:MAG: hypothetical protein QM790_04305 [Nibricoccus sp.]